MTDQCRCGRRLVLVHRFGGGVRPAPIIYGDWLGSLRHVDNTPACPEER